MNYLEKKKKAMLNYVSGGRLPSEYQEVEWIGSSGTQYINTGYNPSSSTCIEVVVSVPRFQLNTEIIGARSGGRYYELLFSGSSGSFYVQMYKTPGTRFSDFGNKNTFKIINGDFYINDELKLTSQQTLSGNTYQISVPIYLFGLNNNGSAQRLIEQTMYYCKIEENNQIQREFIPCYRKSDDVIGMYDIVTQTFYTNAGSGTFTKGQDV